MSIGQEITRSGSPQPQQEEGIVCFAKDWSEEPTSNNHVMVELSKRRPVLWVNSVATRAPALQSKRDLLKIVAKLRSFFRGVIQPHPNLWVYTPVVIPFPHNRFARRANSLILRIALGHLRRRIGMKQFQLWTFLPTTAGYVGKFGESISIYYCTDNWPKFKYVNGPQVQATENDLVRRVDVVFATAQSLCDRHRLLNVETRLARHGVSHELFSMALLERTEIPADIAVIKKPVLGFYGTIQDWLDFNLLEYLAARNPNWSIVLLGKILVDISRFQKYPNVHFLGPRSHGQLPGYCKAFSVAMIPYVMNERILDVNPIKLREYLSAGLPVISTPLPEVKCYSRYCSIANTHAEFESAAQMLIRQDSHHARLERSRAVAGESWASKVAELTQHIARVQQAKY
jgi:hypothetical protein